MEDLTDKLNNFLEENSFKELVNSDILNLINIDIVPEDIKRNYVATGYDKKLLFKNNLYDIYLFIWSQNCDTKIHDHSENGCIMKVLDGELLTTIYNKNLEKMNDKIISNNEVSFISNDIGYHKVKNTSFYSVSIHIYSPPNHNTQYF